MTFDQKSLGSIAVFIAMLASLGIITYQTIYHIPVDIFFSSLFTLLVGKYIQQLGFTQGAEQTANTAQTTAQTVANGVAQGLSTSINTNPTVPIIETKKTVPATSVTGTANGTIDSKN